MKIVNKGIMTAIYEDEHDWWSGAAVGELQRIANLYDKRYVLYFEEVPVVTIKQEEIEGEQVAARLAKKTSIVQQLEEIYDLLDPWTLKNIPTGKNVNSGFLKLLNILGNIRLNPNEEVVVVIEKIENSLHPFLRPRFIEHLLSIKKIKRVVFTTQEIGLFEWIERDIM